MPIRTLSFQVAFNSGKVDHENAVIHDVAVITGDVEAEGHDLMVDNTTVQQLFQAGKKTGQIPVNLDHGSGIKDTCGFLTNFRVAGKKLRADWHLLETHEETPRMLERADRMPGCFGLSVKFKGKGEKKGLKKFARCEKLLSVDCVTQPAANPDGLFSVPVDSAREVAMRTRKTQTRTDEPAAPTTLEDIAELLTQQSEQLADFGNRLDAMEQGGPGNENEADPDVDGQLTDEQIDQLVASGQLLDNGDGTLSWADDAGEGEAGGEGELAGAGAGADAGATAMSAIRAINRFNAQLRTRELQAAAADEEHAFAALDQRIDLLAQQNEELLTELQASEERCEALERTLKFASSQKPAPGRGSVHLFSKKGAEEGSFEAILADKYEELKADGKTSDLSAKSQAITFCIRNHRDAYSEYRSRGGKIQFGK